ncbi:ClC family H(+)/Cl(-) exchange transporter [Ligilactobacillus aviarius]|uniref:ClC family H(+)/Cl(-) exchange transporter n=1 Tax=Ligilactobacillus aviarius TaxID=1606 RepID=UPI0024BA3AE2|nr:ClC family H(+)/Cl(-) exchange transporter [Ligilactobacillus aviarius]
MGKLSVTEILHKPFTSRNLLYVFKGILVGLVTGVVVSIFRLIIDKTMKGLYFIYPYMVAHPKTIILYVIATIILCIVLGFIIRPQLFYVKGSGVPQIEAVMDGQLEMHWWAALWRKFVGGLLAICPGLFLGREGPCIQMGACIGQGFSEEVFHGDKQDRNIMLACGIAAGLSAAFSAPLAGALFLVEEITLGFASATVWLAALAAAVASDLVTLLFFGLTPSLHFIYDYSVPVKDYWQLIILGIILGLFGNLYQRAILSLPKWYGKLTIIPKAWHSIVPLLLVIPIGLYYVKILGGSHDFILDLTSPHFINYLSDHLPAIGFVALLLLIRFVFSMISYGASTPGGIFMPILVLGATSGALYASIMIHAGLLAKGYFLNIVIYAMAAYFGAIEKAPFTAVVLISEMVGSIKHMMPLLVVTLIAYVINDWLGGRPIYAALKDEMMSSLDNPRKSAELTGLRS